MAICIECSNTYSESRFRLGHKYCLSCEMEYQNERLREREEREELKRKRNSLVLEQGKILSRGS